MVIKPCTYGYFRLTCTGNVVRCKGFEPAVVKIQNDNLKNPRERGKGIVFICSMCVWKAKMFQMMFKRILKLLSWLTRGRKRLIVMWGSVYLPNQKRRWAIIFKILTDGHELPQVYRVLKRTDLKRFFSLEYKLHWFELTFTLKVWDCNSLVNVQNVPHLGVLRTKVYFRCFCTPSEVFNGDSRNSLTNFSLQLGKSLCKLANYLIFHITSEKRVKGVKSGDRVVHAIGTTLPMEL